MKNAQFWKIFQILYVIIGCQKKKKKKKSKTVTVKSYGLSYDLSEFFEWRQGKNERPLAVLPISAIEKVSLQSC